MHGASAMEHGNPYAWYTENRVWESVGGVHWEWGMEYGK